METITAFTIAHSITLALSVFAVLRVPVQLIPDLDIRAVTIVTRWPGATPQDVEREILVEQEEYLRAVTGVDREGNRMFLILKDGSRVPVSRGFRAAVEEAGIADSTARHPTLAAWSAERFRVDARIRHWAETIDNIDLKGDLSWYSGAAGRQMAKPMEACVVHMFNHQTHHRGQVHAMLIEAAGRTEGIRADPPPVVMKCGCTTTPTRLIITTATIRWMGNSLARSEPAIVKASSKNGSEALATPRIITSINFFLCMALKVTQPASGCPCGVISEKLVSSAYNTRTPVKTKPPGVFESINTVSPGAIPFFEG